MSENKALTSANEIDLKLDIKILPKDEADWEDTEGNFGSREGVVRSINVSLRKGGRKTPISTNSTCRLSQNHGIDVDGVPDGHAGEWHRQVSMLAWESVCKARNRGLTVKEGDFAENITTEGIDLLAIPVGTRISIGDEVEVELTQIGKECHTRCQIFYLAGDCIFPREGVFFKVIRDGEISVGDKVLVL